MTMTQTATATPAVGSAGKIMAIVENLTGLMSEEVRLLRAMKVREFGALQDRKMSLIKAYEAQTASLREDPAFVGALSPRIRGELKDLMQNMHTVMADNETAILAAREMNHRVAQAIINAVQERKPENSRYSSKGALQASSAAPPVSLQIDQSH